MGWLDVGSAWRALRAARAGFPRGGLGGGSVSPPRRGTPPSAPAPACAVGLPGASPPPFGGGAPGRTRPAGARPRNAPGATRPPVAALTPAGSGTAGFPAPRAAAAGFGAGGGGGATTALRAAALISAIVRVSGWRSGLLSGAFFVSAGVGGAGVPTASGEGAGAAASAGAASSVASARKCARTLSASASSRALECECLSVIPISGRYSRITLLFTSNSRARSLMRILPMLFLRLLPCSSPVS
jgi:hypothetical protein